MRTAIKEVTKEVLEDRKDTLNFFLTSYKHVKINEDELTATFLGFCVDELLAFFTGFDTVDMPCKDVIEKAAAWIAGKES